MYRQHLLERITIEEDVFGGKPCIRGLRIRVIDVLGWLAAGMTREEILSDYPMLEEDDIFAACEYVTYVLANFKPHTITETVPR
jgi:uncharacterized protein (DUF433 family)